MIQFFFFKWLSYNSPVLDSFPFKILSIGLKKEKYNPFIVIHILNFKKVKLLIANKGHNLLAIDMHFFTPNFKLYIVTKAHKRR